MDLPRGPSGVLQPSYKRTTEPVFSSDDENDNMDDVDYQKDSEVEDPDYETNPPQWSAHNRIGMKDIPFTRQEGFLVPLPDDKSPISFFTLFVYIVFLEGIVKATNKYALEFFCGPHTVPSSQVGSMSESSKILSTPIKLSSSNTSLIATSFKLREAMIATSTAGCNERHVSGT
ncbi:hypothetical protein J6590_033760 [Homalodisca vitripennis]|nr:hypothetical protein J6590_033760 [Homalodisca vitripennis]